MLETLQLSTFIPETTAEQIYHAWLDSEAHSALTGGSLAEVDPRVGGRFTAWDGYIQGTTLELQPFRLIVQAWRTTEFPVGHADSRLEVLLEEREGGVQVTLIHSDIPEGQGEDYRQGWEDYYFAPMQQFFSTG